MGVRGGGRGVRRPNDLSLLVHGHHVFARLITHGKTVAPCSRWRKKRRSAVREDARFGRRLCEGSPPPTRRPPPGGFPGSRSHPRNRTATSPAGPALLPEPPPSGCHRAAPGR